MRRDSVHNHLRLCRYPFETTEERKLFPGLFTYLKKRNQSNTMFSRPDFVHQTAKPKKKRWNCLWDTTSISVQDCDVPPPFFFFKCYQGVLCVRRDSTWHYATPLLTSGHFQGQTAAIKRVPWSVSLKWDTSTLSKWPGVTQMDNIKCMTQSPSWKPRFLLYHETVLNARESCKCEIKFWANL